MDGTLFLSKSLSRPIKKLQLKYHICHP